ncbi:MAG: 50S ribosomal protein L3 [Spirochaetales bacterium]|nr:50S ribosomal protein L3 [Spirochaetales bacterium]MBP7262648.1 50S ribosomal protein L3 [Spirochaetia bacterium]
MLALIGKKIGMTQVFDETGRLSPATVIAVEANTVIGRKTEEKDGYNAVILGVQDMKKVRVTKPFAGQFPEGVAPKKVVREMRDFPAQVEVGQALGVDLFNGTRFVDVVATSKGKGFQGVVKRWGFGGGRNTHGSKFHREPGSTGQSTYPHKSFKNVKLPGHMGHERVTVQNLKVLRVDAENGFIVIRGAVPGPRNALVVVRSAVKKAK